MIRFLIFAPIVSPLSLPPSLSQEGSIYQYFFLSLSLYRLSFLLTASPSRFNHLTLTFFHLLCKILYLAVFCHFSLALSLFMVVCSSFSLAFPFSFSLSLSVAVFSSLTEVHPQLKLKAVHQFMHLSSQGIPTSSSLSLLPFIVIAVMLWVNSISPLPAPHTLFPWSPFHELHVYLFRLCFVAQMMRSNAGGRSDQTQTETQTKFDESMR